MGIRLFLYFWSRRSFADSGKKYQPGYLYVYLHQSKILELQELF